MKFTDASAVTRSGEGLYQAVAQPGWDIFQVTNGGYVMAIAGRAMTAEANGRHLASISGRFINPTRPGPLMIDVETVKAGRSLSTLTARVRDDQKTLLIAHATFTDGAHGPDGNLLVHGSPPEIPPVEQCLRLLPDGEAPLPPPFAEQVGTYLHPDDLAHFATSESREALIRGWFQLLDGELLDPLGLVMTSDALPPAVFTSGLPVGWTPTIDLTVHVRNPGPHEWVQTVCRTRFVTGGWLEEDVEMWTPDGVLVAQSRQLALLAR